MAGVKIPSRFMQPLIKLAHLDDAVVAELIIVFNSYPATLFNRDLVDRIVSKVTTVSHEKIKDIVEAVLPMYSAVYSDNVDLDDFISNIVEQLASRDGDEIIANDELLRRVNSRLLLLLKSPSMILGAKATRIMFQNERSLNDADVMTEIRPIFLGQGDLGAVLITHALKLSYTSDDGNSFPNFVVSLDDEDIDKLISRLEAAKTNSKSLKEMLGTASVQVLGGVNYE